MHWVSEPDIECNMDVLHKIYDFHSTWLRYHITRYLHFSKEPRKYSFMHNNDSPWPPTTKMRQCEACWNGDETTEECQVEVIIPDEMEYLKKKVGSDIMTCYGVATEFKPTPT